MKKAFLSNVFLLFHAPSNGFFFSSTDLPPFVCAFVEQQQQSCQSKFNHYNCCCKQPSEDCNSSEDHSSESSNTSTLAESNSSLLYNSTLTCSDNTSSSDESTTTGPPLSASPTLQFCEGLDDFKMASQSLYRAAINNNKNLGSNSLFSASGSPSYSAGKSSNQYHGTPSGNALQLRKSLFDVSPHMVLSPVSSLAVELDSTNLVEKSTPNPTIPCRRLHMNSPCSKSLDSYVSKSPIHSPLALDSSVNRSFLSCSK